MPSPRETARPKPRLHPASTTLGPSAERQEGRTDAWQDFLLRVAVIVLAALWIYSPVYHPFFPADWLWDDDQLLTANATVQSTTPAGLAKLWFDPDGADYFPLSYSALWLQWPFFGTRSTGYHITTILLHISGALLLWRLLTVMKLPGAWLAAVLFAVHPLCVESVAWVSELKNTLSLPLFLLSAIAFVRFDAAAEGDPKRWQWYGFSILFFLLSMFAKTSVVALPVVLLLHAWWKRGTVTLRDLQGAAPFFAISLVLGIITIYYQHGRAIGQETIIVPPYFENGLPSIRGLLSRVAIAGMSTLFYLWKIVWPSTLLPIYARWEIDPPKIWQLLPVPVIGAAAWWFWQNRGTWGRHAIFALGFFLLMVAPVLGFITISYMRITWAADHFVYLPMIGILALIAAAVASWHDRLPASERPLVAAGTSLVLAAFTWMSFTYAGAWVNEDALWTHTLAYNENAWQAHNRLGARKFSRGHVDDVNPPTRIENRGAMHHFTRSTALRPDLGETHNNLGTALSAKGRMDEAIEQFKEACRVTPHLPAIHINLANALAAAGRFTEAEMKYADVIADMEKRHAEAVEASGNPNLPIDQGMAALLNNYAVTLFKQQKKDEAIDAFRRALAINPGLKDAREGLAVATGEKPMPQPPSGQPAKDPPAAAPPLQLPMSLPQSPTLGPLR
ncbi:MAG: tetratricopeptide repeat protein [Pirellulales bacterium]